MARFILQSSDCDLCFPHERKNPAQTERTLLTKGTICTSLKKLEKENFIESCHRKTKKGGNTSKLYRMLFEPFVFKQVKEQHYNCFGQKIDDRLTDRSWAEDF